MLNLKNIFYAKITQFSQFFLRSNNEAESPKFALNGSLSGFFDQFGTKIMAIYAKCDNILEKIKNIEL